MPRSLKIYIAGVVALSAVALVVATLVFPVDSRIAITGSGSNLPPTQTDIAIGLAFWIVLTLVTSALPVKLPLGSHQAVSMAPVVAVMALGGPAAAGWVAAIGTTELREVRGRIPWYGTLANHAGAVLPAVVAGTVYVGLLSIAGESGERNMAVDFFATVAAAVRSVPAQHDHCKWCPCPANGSID